MIIVILALVWVYLMSFAGALMALMADADHPNDFRDWQFWFCILCPVFNTLIVYAEIKSNIRRVKAFKHRY